MSGKVSLYRVTRLGFWKSAIGVDSFGNSSSMFGDCKLHVDPHALQLVFVRHLVMILVCSSRRANVQWRRERSRFYCHALHMYG